MRELPTETYARNMVLEKELLVHYRQPERRPMSYLIPLRRAVERS